MTVVKKNRWRCTIYAFLVLCSFSARPILKLRKIFFWDYTLIGGFLELNLKVYSLFSKENLFSVVQVLCIKSSTILSLGHTRKPNLEILQKAKLPIFCLKTQPWSDYFWLWFQVIYLICLQCYYQHVFSHEEHINLVVALRKSKQKHQKKN